MIQTRQRDVQTPHFKHPFSFGGFNGAAMVNEQDTEEDVLDCCELILAYPIGSREDLPDFGCADLLFKQRSESAAMLIEAALLIWEPRSETVVGEEADWDQFMQHFHVQVTTSGGEA